MSIRKIAREEKVPIQSVREVLKAAGVHLNRFKMSFEALIPQIIAMYHEEVPMSQIRRRLGVTQTAIYKVLRDANLPVLDNRRAQRKLDETIVVQRYTSGESVSTLCTEFGVVHSVIRKILKRHGVITRRRAEGVRLASDRRCLDKAKSGYVHIHPGQFSSLKHNARTRQIDFSLTPFDIEAIYQRQGGKCYYTGIPLFSTNQEYIHRDNTGRLDCLSFDRKDSDLGYTADNLVLCCATMNYAKKDWGATEFQAFLRRAALNIVTNNQAEELTAQTEDSLAA